MYDQDSAIRTNRNIKSSLDIMRRKERSPKGIITSIEEEFKKDLEARYGALVTQNDVSGIVKQEELRNENQALALDKARLKMLRLKEKIRMIQLIRSSHSLFDQIREHIEPISVTRGVTFKRVNISY